jgi:hypothetical protein
MEEQARKVEEAVRTAGKGQYPSSGEHSILRNVTQGQSEDIDVDGMIMLKWFSRKMFSGRGGWNGFV